MKTLEPKISTTLLKLPKQSVPARPRFLHLRLSCLIFLAFTVMGSWVPVFSLYLKNLQFSPTATAWASAANAIGAILAPLIWGQIADRWLAKERCISLSAVATGIGLWSLSALEDPLAVIAVCIVIWFFLIPVVGLTGAFIFRQLEHPEQDYGKIRLWGTLGWMAANWGLTVWFRCAYDSETVDLADSLRLGGLAAFVVAVYALTLPHAPPSAMAANGSGPLAWLHRMFDAPLRAMRLFRVRSFAIYCGCMFGFYITVPFTIQLNPLLLDSIGIKQPDLPLVLTICQSTEVVLLALLPTLLARYGLRATMAVGAVTWTFGLAALSFGSPNGLVLTALASGGVFICCFVIAGQVYVNRLATPDIRASAQALLVFINGSGLLLGHFVVGIVRQLTDDHYRTAYLIAMVVSTILFLLFAVGFTVREPAKTKSETLVPEAEMP
jgi:MFS family permease